MISFSEARAMWAKIGLLSFGGPAGQIALMHREVIDKRKLIEEKEFLSALNFCMLLPGPEAMQLATYIGWKLHGVKGGLVAGFLFILPGAAVLYALSVIYTLYGAKTFRRIFTSWRLNVNLSDTVKNQMSSAVFFQFCFAPRPFSRSHVMRFCSLKYFEPTR